MTTVMKKQVTILSDDELNLKLDRSRWYLLQKLSWYGAPLCNLKDKLMTKMPTAATDGKYIYWGRKFLSGLDEQEVRFVHCHELLHNLHLHLWRLPRTREGNIAGDHVINLILSKIPGLKMPACGLLDQQYVDMAEEEILARVPKQPPRKGGDPGGDPGDGDGEPGEGDPIECEDEGGCGGFIDPADKDDKKGGDKDPTKSTESLRDRWERALIQAEITAKVLNKGDMPGHFDRLLKRVRAEEIDWRQETAEFIRNAIAMRNDWTRSAKRHAHQPVIYPRKRRKDNLGKVIFVRDTSGSVTDGELAQYTALVNACLAEQQCEGIVFDCDSMIHARYDVDGDNPCPPHGQGGGGTDFRPPFLKAQEIIEEGEEISGLVYITDMCGTFPSEAPEFPVLWISKGSFGTYAAAAPFGRTIQLK